MSKFITEEDMNGYTPFEPQITNTEVSDYEERFKEKVYHDVDFERDDKGVSIRLYNGESGAEALWAGVVRFGGESRIKFQFSVQNGCFIEAVMELDDNNYKVVTNMYEFYQTWKEEWSQMLTMKEKPEVEDDMMGAEMAGGAVGAPGLPGAPPEMAPGTEGMGAAPGAMPIAESRKSEGRRNNINKSSDRMRKLAGLD